VEKGDSVFLKRRLLPKLRPAISLDHPPMTSSTLTVDKIGIGMSTGGMKGPETIIGGMIEGGMITGEMTEMEEGVEEDMTGMAEGIHDLDGTMRGVGNRRGVEIRHHLLMVSLIFNPAFLAPTKIIA
jgi:hypothetical protein